jgi:hypothetical protein
MRKIRKKTNCLYEIVEQVLVKSEFSINAAGRNVGLG